MLANNGAKGRAQQMRALCKLCLNSPTQSGEDVIKLRLTTGIWWGSRVNMLESEIQRLLHLRELSSNSFVQYWVDKTVALLKIEIADQRRRDANRDADFEKYMFFFRFS